MKLTAIARRGFERGRADFRPGRDVMVLAARRLDGALLRFGCDQVRTRLYSWSYCQGFAAAAAARATT